MLDDIESIVIFKDVHFQDLSGLAALCTREQHNDGDLLIMENDREKFDLFILRRGLVEVVSNSSSSVSGEVVLSREKKELFGEVSWLTKSKRTASVRCRGPVEVIRIDGHGLDRFMEAHPRAGMAIMRQIAIFLSERLTGTDVLLKQILWNVRI